MAIAWMEIQMPKKITYTEEETSPRGAAGYRLTFKFKKRGNRAHQGEASGTVPAACDTAGYKLRGGAWGRYWVQRLQNQTFPISGGREVHEMQWAASHSRRPRRPPV